KSRHMQCTSACRLYPRKRHQMRGDDRESEPSCAVWAIRERSLQIISYLSDARISTRLVLLTAGCTRDADGTNYFVTRFDRHAATNRNHIRDLLQIGTLRLIGQILELK